MTKAGAQDDHAWALFHRRRKQHPGTPALPLATRNTVCHGGYTAMFLFVSCRLALPWRVGNAQHGVLAQVMSSQAEDKVQLHQWDARHTSHTRKAQRPSQLHKACMTHRLAV
jgi:hypothetical protein